MQLFEWMTFCFKSTSQGHVILVWLHPADNSTFNENRWEKEQFCGRCKRGKPIKRHLSSEKEVAPSVYTLPKNCRKKKRFSSHQHAVCKCTCCSPWAEVLTNPTASELRNSNKGLSTPPPECLLTWRQINIPALSPSHGNKTLPPTLMGPTVDLLTKSSAVNCSEFSHIQPRGCWYAVCRSARLLFGRLRFIFILIICLNYRVSALLLRCNSTPQHTRNKHFNTTALYDDDESAIIISLIKLFGCWVTMLMYPFPKFNETAGGGTNF